MFASPAPILSLLVALFVAGLRASEPADGLARFGSAELRAHDARAAELQAELGKLPAMPEVQSSTRIGWHSDFNHGPRAADVTQSVMLDLGASESFDSVVLVPVNVAYGSHPGPGYGFPVRFRIEAADDSDFSMPMMLADHTASDFPNPGNLPVHLETPGTRARYVRITATRLFVRSSDEQALFALGEFMVWRGRTNLASVAKCRTTSNYENAPAWHPDNLNDGQTVLGPPMRLERTPGNGYHSLEAQLEFSEKWVQLDLGESLPLDEVRLFAARPQDFPVRSGFGFPVRFRVEASDAPDFTRPVSLREFRDTDCENPGDNPFIIPARGITARYVRVTATRLWLRHDDFVFALGEMQVFSGNENVALKAMPSASESIELINWKLAYLNDGFTSQGRLIDWHDWLRGLSRRREAAQEIAMLDAARGPLVTAAFWRLGKWTAVAVGGVAALTAWWSMRLRRQRRIDVRRLRTRIASDLHDEIGSNLGTIALLANLAGEHDLNGAHADLAEIQRIARETTDSMRDIVWLIHPGPRDAKDLLVRMREVAAQQLPDTECRFEAEGVTGPFSLEFERQVFLLFKEALNNIRKHSHAHHIAIRVTQNARDFVLLIADDGAGFDPAAPATGHGLTSMKYRAGLLGGTLTLQSHPAQGTHLELRTRLP